jgi:hypothetical protein
MKSQPPMTNLLGLFPIQFAFRSAVRWSFWAMVVCLPGGKIDNDAGDRLRPTWGGFLIDEVYEIHFYESPSYMGIRVERRPSRCS